MPRGSLSPESLSLKEYGRGIFEKNEKGQGGGQVLLATSSANVSSHRSDLPSALFVVGRDSEVWHFPRGDFFATLASSVR